MKQQIWKAIIDQDRITLSYLLKSREEELNLKRIFIEYLKNSENVDVNVAYLFLKEIKPDLEIAEAVIFNPYCYENKVNLLRDILETIKDDKSSLLEYSLSLDNYKQNVDVINHLFQYNKNIENFYKYVIDMDERQKFVNLSVLKVLFTPQPNPSDIYCNTFRYVKHINPVVFSLLFDKFTVYISKEAKQKAIEDLSKMYEHENVYADFLVPTEELARFLGIEYETPKIINLQIARNFLHWYTDKDLKKFAYVVQKLNLDDPYLYAVLFSGAYTKEIFHYVDVLYKTYPNLNEKKFIYMALDPRKYIKSDGTYVENINEFTFPESKRTYTPVTKEVPIVEHNLFL